MTLVRLSIVTALVVGVVLPTVSSSPTALAQRPTERATDVDRFGAMRWRSIGPYRGGRVTAVSGVPGQPHTYYMGATGGGVWKTEDGGTSWNAVSDGFFRTGSIGAIAVADANPQVVYVGTGEACVRSNFSEGDGVYRSADGGRTWSSAGLVETKQIGRIRVHPTNPDIVFVAALGNVFGRSRDRGVYRSRDGGRTWQQVLFVDDETGAVDVAIDPHAPDTIFAGFWHVRRKPWGIFSGGAGSGLFKSTDGGTTWTRLEKGLPAGMTGRVGVAVSPVDGNRVYAIVEARDGGIFRSDDGGATWRRTNDDGRLRERAWYYSHIIADPKERDTVYVLTLQINKSTDGGQTFETIRPRHVDNHDLWIAPDDNRRMVNGNDGGANVSVNGGRTWTSQDNQATAQFYRVTTDTQFPYRIYGAQQDNSTVSIPSRTGDAGIDATDWHAVGGGESGWIAPDLRNPDVVYAGSYYGLLTRYDHRSGQTRNITIWPESNGGRPAREMKYRFQWSFPILTSPHDQGTLYAAANVLFRSTNEGQTWTALGGDLTRNDRETQGPVGGELTGDNSSADYYGTIFTVAESPRAKGTIWTGSDDGLIHVTTDGGSRWANVTPAALPAFSRVNSIEASPHDAQTAWAAVTRYQSDDRRPYVYVTTDLGRTWRVTSSGIPDGAFVRVVREDPQRKGLLLAGTERGVFVSFNAGAAWEPLQLNLPAVPITDLALRDNDVVAATQGRSFWVLDDITPLRHWQDASASDATTLYPPSVVYRRRQGGFGGGDGGAPSGLGQNPPSGALVYFRVSGSPTTVALTFLDAQGAAIRRIPLASPPAAGGAGTPGGPARPTVRPGLNRFVWDLRYPDASPQPSGTVMFGGSTRGPLAPPGRYTVRLEADGRSFDQPMEIRRDPRLPWTDADLQRQFDLSIRIRDRVTAAHEAARKILELRRRLAPVTAVSSKMAAPIVSAGKALDRDLADILEALVQMRIRDGNDVLSYPIRLNNRIASVGAVVGSADAPPTDQAVAAFDELSKELDVVLARLDGIGTRLAALNDQLRAAGQTTIEPPQP